MATANDVVLRAITMDNFAECLHLAVREDQKGFVASNMYSLAEAKADGVSIPCAIYADRELVGFIMYDIAANVGRGYVTRLMVDAHFQGRGYGRAAMGLVIERMKAKAACREIYTSYVPENEAAGHLYRSLGFEPTGEVDHGETVMRLVLRDGWFIP